MRNLVKTKLFLCIAHKVNKFYKITIACIKSINLITYLMKIEVVPSFLWEPKIRSIFNILFCNVLGKQIVEDFYKAQKETLYILSVLPESYIFCKNLFSTVSTIRCQITLLPLKLRYVTQIHILT